MLVLLAMFNILIELSNSTEASIDVGVGVDAASLDDDVASCNAKSSPLYGLYIDFLK